MQGIDISNLITVIVALFGGGVVGVVIKALTEKRKINAAHIAVEFYLRICAQMRVSADYDIRELVAAELLHCAHRAAVVYRVDVAFYAVVFSVL